MEPKFEVLQMTPENTNSVLVTVGKDCVIFDAWGRADAWEKLLSARGLNLRAIYTTHGHPDHISAAPHLADKYGVPWYLNRADNDLILLGNSLLDYFEIPLIKPDFTPPHDLPAGQYEILPGLWMRAICSPGHSAGGMMFLFPDYDILLVGDTIFQTDIGRTDFPTGNADELVKSIYNLYNMNLSDGTYVVHGHGMDTTIGWLRANNPYFRDCHCMENPHKCCCGGHCNHCE